MHDSFISTQIEQIKGLLDANPGYREIVEAGTLALNVLDETVGRGHSTYATLHGGMNPRVEVDKILAACRHVVLMYEKDRLTDPRLRIARDLEGDILDVARTRVRAAAKITEPNVRQIKVAVAAFLAGCALEDALRRICDKRAVEYDAGTSIQRLLDRLYRPKEHIEHINKSEYKQIVAWGDIRNNADHAGFEKLLENEVGRMIDGVSDFIQRHLP